MSHYCSEFRLTSCIFNFLILIYIKKTMFSENFRNIEVEEKSCVNILRRKLGCLVYIIVYFMLYLYSYEKDMQNLCSRLCLKFCPSLCKILFVLVQYCRNLYMQVLSLPFMCFANLLIGIFLFSYIGSWIMHLIVSNIMNSVRTLLSILIDSREYWKILLCWRRLANYNMQVRPVAVHAHLTCEYIHTNAREFSYALPCEIKYTARCRTCIPQLRRP